MHYETTEDLPETIRALPEDAQDIYLDFYRRSWETHNDAVEGMTRKGLVHRDAWAAVKRDFVQDQTGRWHRRGTQEDESPWDPTNVLNKRSHSPPVVQGNKWI